MNTNNKAKLCHILISDLKLAGGVCKAMGIGCGKSFLQTNILISKMSLRCYFLSHHKAFGNTVLCSCCFNHTKEETYQRSF
jgi:hypothetical protein